MAEGLVDRTWHEGRPGIRAVLDWNAERDSVIIACFVKNPDLDTVELAGATWINRVTKVGDERKAEVGAVFYRQYQDQSLTYAWGKMGLLWGVDNLGITGYFSTTPTKNRAAIRYALRLGFKWVADLPMWETWEGKACGSWLGFMAAEEVRRMQ